MKTRLEFEIGFGKSDIDPAASSEPSRMLVIGDFSGAGARSDAPADGIWRNARIRRIDIDNFDSILTAIAPSAGVSLNGQQETLRFTSLDDFDADAILRRSALLTAIETKPAPSAAPPASQTDNNEDRSGMLKRLLGKAPDTARSPGEALIDQLVSPYLEQTAPAGPTVAKNTDALAIALRALLHAPAFQSLEADWRALHWLISQIESDEDARCFLLDAPIQAFASADEDNIRSLRDKLMDAGALGDDGSGLSVILGSYYFDGSDGDFQILDRAATIARALNSHFLSAADASLLGHANYVEAAARDWKPDEAAAERWQAFRRSPAAESISLALPRVLLRQPYGKDSEALDSFDFEEMDATPAHADYLWGNPVYALAIGLLSKGDAQTIDNMPMHVYTDNGEKHIKPCAELWISEASVHKLMQLGFTPVASIRNQNAIRVFSPRTVGQGIA